MGLMWLVLILELQQYVHPMTVLPVLESMPVLVLLRLALLILALLLLM
jgi:hypothetical protein